MLCAWCQNEALVSLPSRCYKCAKKTENFAVCPTHRKLSPLKHVWVLSEYEGLAKDLIYALKFNRASAAADSIAQLLDDMVPYFENDNLVTNLPTANVRVRLRGYDQSRLIAKSFAAKRGLVYVELLARLGSTRQVGAKREQRLTQATNSYRGIKAISGQKVLLIDDILTTGASLESAAKVLKKSGAKEVNALVFARAI